MANGLKRFSKVKELTYINPFFIYIAIPRVNYIQQGNNRGMQFSIAKLIYGQEIILQ